MLSHLIPTDSGSFYSGLVIGEASAEKPQRHGRKGYSKQSQAPQTATSAVQAIQALQQAAATQRKLQHVQNMVAAQQKHVQKVQQIVAAHRQAQKLAAPPPAVVAAMKAAASSSPGNHHQALIQRALGQVKGRHRPQVSGGGQSQHIQKIKNLAARIAGRNPSATASTSGKVHQAVLRAIAQQSKHGHALGNGGRGLGQATKQGKVFQHVLAKLTNRPHFASSGSARHSAVFKHIHAKLSRKSTSKQTTPAPSPAPAPAPVVAAKTTPKASTGLPNTLPTVVQSSGGPTVVAAVAAVASAVKGGEGGEGTSGGNLLGGTMSKLGGPKQPSEAGSGGGGERATNKAARDEDDDAKEGGIVNALRNSGKPGRGGSIGSLNPMAGLPVVGTFNPRQVLAVNLSPAGLAKVEALKFKVKGRYELPLLGVTITKLETPAQEGAVLSIGKLGEAISDSAFTLNRVYAPYRLGASGSGAGPGNPLPLGNGCDDNRCFGTSLINWRPQLASCAQGVRIGIIDTGVDRSHPALKNAPIRGYEEFVPEGSERATRDHGTGILSILAGRPESSTPGLVPHADYWVANAFYAETASGPAMSETVHMLQALNWLNRNGVQIINLSFSGPRDDLVHRAIKKLERKGVIVVAAAGNDGPNAPPSYPAGYEEVVAVTAVDRNLAPYRYANRGNHIAVAAPGVGIWTALADRREGPQTGTSFAAPFVTGVLALNHAVLESMDDSLSPREQALHVLNSSAMKLGGPQDKRVFGAGLVRAPDACPTAAGTPVAKTAPTIAPRETVIKASTAPLGDWGKGTTVHAATGK